MQLLYDKAHLQCDYCNRKNTLRSVLMYYFGIAQMNYYRIFDEIRDEHTVICLDCMNTYDEKRIPRKRYLFLKYF